MTETARIRWEDNERRWDDNGTILGYVGTRSEWLFAICEANDDADDEELVLTVAFPGTHQAGSIGTGVSPVDLKAEAERWLTGFVTSLGATFPAEAVDDLFGDEDGDGEPLEVKYAAGRRVRYAHPDAGYPGEAALVAASLVLGEVYTIGWADIGQSRTNLNLYRDGKPVGSFNSVFFEPADDEPPANPAPAGEE